MQVGRDELGDAEPFGGWRDERDALRVEVLLAELDPPAPREPEASGSFGEAMERIPLGIAIGDAAVALGTLRGASPSWHPADRLPSLRFPAERKALEEVLAPVAALGLKQATACSTDTVVASLVAAVVAAVEAEAGPGSPVAADVFPDARLIIWRGALLIVVRNTAGVPIHLVGPAFLEVPGPGQSKKSPKKPGLRSRPRRPEKGPRPQRGAKRSPGKKAD